MSDAISKAFNSQQSVDAAPVRMSGGKLQAHYVCDLLSEFLIYLMVVFTPWAFGTTEPWSIWTMNVGGYALGGLLLLKLAIRWSTGYQFPRWDVHPELGQTSSRGRSITVALAVVSALVLGFCFLSAWNARSTFDPGQAQFLDHPYKAWLPHSYDGPSSWAAFFNYLSIGLAFWAVRDWLLGKTDAEQRVQSIHPGTLSARLKRLLWVITISGGLLAVEGLVQRLCNSGALLFLVRPKIHHMAVDLFGPYAYRSNAAQYFNLVWPLSLGLWWGLGRGETPFTKGQRGRRFLVLACVFLMALCPLVATSRLGAATGLAGILIAAAILWSGLHGKGKARALGVVGLILVVGGILGWENLEGRVTSDAVQEGLAIRDHLYEMADPMLNESPFFGTGPGTFGNLFMMFRFDPDEDWWAQLHNDWLQTLITFGWVGMALLMAALILAAARHWSPGGIGAGHRFPRLLILGLATCLFQARWDFPFQIYSIVFTFVLACAIASALSNKPFRHGSSSAGS